ncbi:MAG: glycoside-pentoside-hexuronide (GPH):cation symporter [Clostridia bacterium]|nr:glycoside-pentoside-hexuronide (GPH):cation symporter [Clostridia bacterium]
MSDKIKFLKSKLGYSVGAVGLDLSYGMFYSYLSVYMSKVLQLPAAFLLVLSAVARIWDGINDPMMGTIVDNTNTKLGKYRPWILRGTLSNAVVLTLLFTNLFNLHGTALYIYIAVMYIAWGMTNTMADIPFWSMIPSFTNDPEERNLVSTMTRVFSGLGQGIVTVLAPILLVKFSNTYDIADPTKKTYDARGFLIWTVICAVCLVLFGLLCVSRTKETNVIKAKEKFSFSKAFGVVKGNDQLLIFMLFAMLSNAGWYLTSGTAAYFFADVVGDPGKQSAFGLFGGVGSAAGIVVLPILTKFTSKRRTYQISLITCILGYIGMFLFARNGLLMPLNICYIITSVGMSTMFVAQTIFLADVVDYGEIKLGTRAESITFSMKGFLQKMAYTIQTVILYASLWATRYDAQTKVSVINDGTKATITALTFIVPAVLFVFFFIFFIIKFKLNCEFMDGITQKIYEKRESAES